MALGQSAGGVGFGRAARRIRLRRSSRRFPAKAKNVIFLFMAGAPSHLELFDYKPQLAKFDGTLPPPELLKGYRAAFINPNSKLLGPKFKFAKHGQSGRGAFGTAAASGEGGRRHRDREIDGHRRVQSCAGPDSDEHRLAAVRPAEHGCVGDCMAWAANRRILPAFVVFSSGKKGPSGGNSCWGSGFLPTVYQGVQFRSERRPGAVSFESARRR